MTHRVSEVLSHRVFTCLLTFLSLTLPAYSQVTLTGAGAFAATSSGATSIQQGYADGYYNTLGGDSWWDLWLALNPDATSPVNSPSDAQANIAIPVQAGNRYKYYAFGGNCCFGLSYSGLNLFFDGNNSAPGISVFAPDDSLDFVPNTASTLSLAGNPVPGSGSSFYRSAGVIVLLSEFAWGGYEKPPGNVCQPDAFTPNPGGEACSYGSFTLDVLPAAGLSVSQSSGSPETGIGVIGSEFIPGETVEIFTDKIGSKLLATATVNANGDFSATVREPQHPYGSLAFFAVGRSSGKLGAATISVTPAVIGLPGSVEPGGVTDAEGAGFGNQETVSVYLASPRQLLGTTATNSLGSFVGNGALSVTIPENTPTGLNALIGIGATTGAIGVGAIDVK